MAWFFPQLDSVKKTKQNTNASRIWGDCGLKLSNTSEAFNSQEVSWFWFAVSWNLNKHELNLISTPELHCIRGKYSNFTQVVWRAFTGPCLVLKRSGKARGSSIELHLVPSCSQNFCSVCLLWLGEQAALAISQLAVVRLSASPWNPALCRSAAWLQAGSWVLANWACYVPAGWGCSRTRP